MRTSPTLLHGGALGWFLRVWLWHLTPTAARLPGAVTFGWFFKYMTWWGFSLQIITLAVCFLDDILPPHAAETTAARSAAAAAVAAAAGERPPALQPEQASGRGSKGSGRHGRPTLTVLADDLACMSFAFAHVVSIMYFAVNALTKGGADEGDLSLRPFWLSPTTHQLNSIVAWLDLLLAQPRNFSGRARVACCCVAAAYTGWILVCRQVSGRFPYPFLNVLPFPSGFIATAAASILVFVVFFQIGAAMNAVVRMLARRRARKEKAA